MTIDRNCLDAETVAAWMDGGLDAAGVAAAEAHASTCERCQALLATVAKTMPATEAGGLKAASIGSKTGTSWWRWWLAPLAATAAAVTIWMVVPQTPMQAPMEPPAADSSAKPPPPAEPEAQAPAAATPPPPARDNAQRNVPTASGDAQNTLAATAADTATVDTLGRKDKREESKALAEMRQAAEPAPAPAVPLAGTSAERRREASAPSIDAATQLRKQATWPEIVSPDPVSRWRATPGRVERSEDGGRIWMPVRVRANEEALAGTAPGRLVCWLVGRNGLVLLATDGTNFTRLPFPESVDLVAVSSPEAGIATVTTADGRTFRTEDTGRNWRQQ